MQENGLIKKLKLISKFMTPQTVQQIITIHILPNIVKNKGNQAVKIGQLIEYKVRNIFPKNDLENEAGILVPDLFLFSKKTL